MESARPAVPADLERLAELAAEARASVVDQRGGRLYLTREARDLNLDDRSILDLDDRLTVVGCLDDVVVGYAIVRREPLRDGSTIGVVDDLYVEPDARGVGVGEALMDLVVAWCTACGCRGIDAIALPGDRETKNFFERFGLTARAIVVHRPLAP